MYPTKEQIVHFVETFSLRCHLQELIFQLSQIMCLWLEKSP